MPRIPAASPCSTATPPSADWRRQTDSGRMSWVDAPATTPSIGPPISAASTMTGVEAVYQLRGPSWTTHALGTGGGEREDHGHRHGRLE